MVQISDQFPDFSLPNQNGEVITLKDLLGKPFVMFFYPKDLTSGCTTEACEFNKSLPDFANTRVIGVSPDPIKLHQKFINKHALNYTLLSDENKVLLEKLGIWIEKSMYGKKYMGVARTTILVDENGSIAEIWEKVKPEGHATIVLERVNQLGN